MRIRDATSQQDGIALAKKNSALNKKNDEPTFEQSLERLEAIVADLEGGKLGLSDSIAKYEEGVKCLKQCYQELTGAERKIELLAGFDAEGNPITEAFDEQAMSLEEKQQSRGRRRSHTGNTGPRSSGTTGRVDDQGGLF
jgi:exodeoxyribonuclease VII small subunit